MQGVRHLEPCRREVDVSPPNREKLAQPQAEVDSDPERNLEPVSAGRAEQRAGLLEVERLDGCTLELWLADDGSDVPRHLARRASWSAARRTATMSVTILGERSLGFSSASTP